MKQGIKKLGLLFLLVILFNSSQEKECLSLTNCTGMAPVAREKVGDNVDASNYDELVPLSPISRFILIQY